jgi:hypothetical protein
MRILAVGPPKRPRTGRAFAQFQAKTRRVHRDASVWIASELTEHFVLDDNNVSAANPLTRVLQRVRGR